MAIDAGADMYSLCLKGIITNKHVTYYIPHHIVILYKVFYQGPYLDFIRKIQ